MSVAFRIRTQAGQELSFASREAFEDFVRSGDLSLDDLVYDAETGSWSSALTHPMVLEIQYAAEQAAEAEAAEVAAQEAQADAAADDVAPPDEDEDEDVEEDLGLSLAPAQEIEPKSLDDVEDPSVPEIERAVMMPEDPVEVVADTADEDESSLELAPEQEQDAEEAKRAFVAKMESERASSFDFGADAASLGSVTMENRGSMADMITAAPTPEPEPEVERPLIYAGGGVINAEATKPMRRLAKTHGIPVTTTLMALGASDTTHPLALHMLGMHGLASANYAVEDCDFLIAIGARFDDRVAGDPPRFAPNARRIAHFDVDIAEIGKVQVLSTGITSASWPATSTNSSPMAGASASTSASTTWHEHIENAESRRTVSTTTATATLIQPYAVIEEINRHSKRRGNHHDRRRPAPDVGCAVLRLSRAAALADVRQHGHDGFRTAGRDRRAVRRARSDSSSTSTATPACA